MKLEIIVEGLVTAIEILHLIVFFEAANDNGQSVPHSPNQGIGRAFRLPRGNEFSETLQFAPGPFDFDSWQNKVRSHSFQPWKKQYLTFPAGALAHNPAPQFSLRHGPSEESQGIGQEVGVTRELQILL
jgi:hypothetical protein